MKLGNKNIYIRKAGGSYWIVRTGDDILEYQNPIMLNETGAKIYELLEDGYSEGDVASYMVREYDISYEEALSDAESFINMLIDSGLRE